MYTLEKFTDNNGQPIQPNKDTSGLIPAYLAHIINCFIKLLNNEALSPEELPGELYAMLGTPWSSSSALAFFNLAAQEHDELFFAFVEEGENHPYLALAKAAADCGRSAEQGPTEANLRFLAFLSQFKNADIQTIAITQAQESKATPLPANTVKACMQRGLDHFKKDEFLASIKAYEEALRNIGEHPNEHAGVCFYNIGSCHDRLENLDSAIEATEKALEIRRNLFENDDPRIKRAEEKLEGLCARKPATAPSAC